LKILQVIGGLNPESGGPVEGLIQQGTVMVAEGHDVQTLCLDAPGSPLDARLSSSAVYQLGPSYLGYGYAPRLEPWLREHGAKFDVIIIHGMWMYHGYCVAKVARQLGLRYVIFLHGMLDPWFARRYPLKHLKKWLYWPWGEYRVLRDANLVLFTTAEEQVLARQSFWLYKARERLVGYGIKSPDVEPTVARSAFLALFPELAGKRNLLYLSRIHPKKGCDLLIIAFAKVAVSDPALHLIMAGPGEAALIDALKNQAAQLGVAHRVTFTGMIKGEVKWGAYDVAEAFVLSSHQENFGIVVAEALACGVPVLTTYQVNIWREIKEDGAGIIHADTQAGADQLLADWLALNPDQKSVMRVNAKACFNRHFEIHNVSQNLIKALEDVKDSVPVAHSFNGGVSEFIGSLPVKIFTLFSTVIFYLLAMLLVAALDAQAGAQVNLWVLYGVPIGLATWHLGRRMGVLLTLLAAMLLVSTAIVWGHPYSSLGYLALASGSKIIAYGVLVSLLGALRRKQVERVFLPPKQRS
jgi:glycosyltransferase involved in cell wall biosynthesis